MSLNSLASDVAPLAAARATQGQALEHAIAGAVADLNLGPPAGNSTAEEVAEQLVAPVLCALEDSEFVPAGELADPVAEDAEKALVEAERCSVLVLNQTRGMVHRAVLTAVVQPPGTETTACGWKFGAADSVSFPDAAAVPEGFTALCGKCLPRWRARRKRPEASR